MEMPSSSSNYDVFLSFRGVDTRKNFTDHLYAALKREGIHTFRDNVELETGRSIGPEVRKAIEGSKISIVVFSINYAWSRWCLDELARIMKCGKELRQWVLPIFYNVQPKVVRHQTESFRDAFAAHELRFKDDLGRWRAALGEAANLAGVDVQNHGDGYESTIINDIVKDICDKLNRKRLCVPSNLVGLHSRVDQVMSLLVIDNLDEIRMVGICGMGGIGKTTTAKEVYNLIFQNFQGSCFLTNIPQKPDCNDMASLQNQLVSEILKVKHEDVFNVHRGFEMIQERLRDKRVLIVVDDVNEIEQLKYILGNYTWLSYGSRIIITTRTLDLEKPSRGYHQYLVEVLDEGESLQLFSLHCFEECHPPKEYMKLAKSVIGYAGGIPLALEVLGSTLSGQSANVWKRRLEKLKAIPDRRIQDVLKTSYDCLDDVDKSLFLDIACFFVVDLDYCHKDYLISILDEMCLESSDLHLGNLVALDMQFSKLKVWGEMELPKLKFLDLSFSRELTETPNFDGLPNLEVITLDYCVNLLKVHESICPLTKLVQLNLDSCSRLCLLPKLPSSLITLVAFGCKELQRINLTNFHLLAWFTRYDEGTTFDGFLEKEPMGVGDGEKIVVLAQMEIQISTFQLRTRSAGTKISDFQVNNLGLLGFLYP